MVNKEYVFYKLYTWAYTNVYRVYIMRPWWANPTVPIGERDMSQQLSQNLVPVNGGTPAAPEPDTTGEY